MSNVSLGGEGFLFFFACDMEIPLSGRIKLGSPMGSKILAAFKCTVEQFAIGILKSLGDNIEAELKHFDKQIHKDQVHYMTKTEG